MSFWDFIFDSDFRQRRDIERLRERSSLQMIRSRGRHSQTEAQLDELRDRVNDLEEEVGAIQLMNRALIACLRQSETWDEERFNELVYSLDLEDGKIDGK